MSPFEWLVLLPFLASLCAFVAPISGKGLKTLAICFSFIPLIFLVVTEEGLIGQSIQKMWLKPLSIEFYLMVDRLSYIFLFLTAVIIPISLFAVRSSKLHHPNAFYGLVLLLQAFLIVFFTARDLAVFTIFWEAMLLPLYFIINLWGGARREYASLKFLIYMIAGSSLMVAAVLSLYFSSGQTFNIDVLAQGKHALWIGAIFLFAFAVKTPLFPFHAWLPDVYTQASTAGTILLSAILSKAGIYGVLRLGTELFQPLMREYSPVLLMLAITGVLYGGMAAWSQRDYKRLIAYSSFSHVNFIFAALFIWNEAGQTGAILQSINHAITIAALFLAAGWLEERIGTTALGPWRGLATYFPVLCWMTLIFVLSNVALPGLNNFVGEILILYGLFIQNPWLAFILGLSVILSVVYMLRWMQKAFFDSPNAYHVGWVDLRKREIAIGLVLGALILWIGIYPTPILHQIEPVAQSILREVKP